MAAWENYRVLIAWSTQPDDPQPAYVDMTSRVDVVAQPIVINRGRPTERGAIEPSTATFALSNHDHAFTPGNRLSPYYPYVRPGRKVQITETVGGTTFYLFTGYLNFPEIGDWAEADADQPFDQAIVVSATDRLERLNRGRTFISTLAEHIMYNGGPGLVGYYPMGETRGRTIASEAGSRVPATLTESAHSDGSTVLADYAGGAGPTADDLALLRYTPRIDDPAVGTTAYVEHVGSPASPLVVSGGQTLTVAFWTRPDAPIPINSWIPVQWSGTGDLLYVLRQGNGGSPPNVYEVSALAGATGSTVTLASVTEPAPEVALLIAARVTVGSGLVELWIHGQEPITGVMSGTPPTSLSLPTLTVGHQLPGTMGHQQHYVGDSTVYTREQHLAQIVAGTQGLERQRADERIATLAAYAGVAAEDLVLDVASALMPVARLAGQKPGPLMTAAATADSGLLFTAGDGRLVFHSRSRRYNPPVAAVVQRDWLLSPLPMRHQPPINASTVTQSPSGLVGRSTNTASRDEYGEYSDGGDLTIETICDADPRNLADWVTATNAVPRMRVPGLTLSLLHMTTADAQTILAREIGDLVLVAGMADNTPEGATSLHVEGITHVISTDQRAVRWNTSPVLGTVPGVPDAWAEVGSAVATSAVDFAVVPY